MRNILMIRLFQALLTKSFTKLIKTLIDVFFSKAGKWVVRSTTGFQKTDSVTVIKCLRP